MTLHELLNKVDFSKVFSDILRHVPEVENKRTQFLLAFYALRLITPEKESRSVIEVIEKSYLGDGVQGIWIDATNIWQNLLAGQIKRDKPNSDVEIGDDSIMAEILWQFVAYGFPENTAVICGYILNNRRRPDSTKSDRIEEICRYIDFYHVTGISHEDIRRYRNATNVAWISKMTSYTLPMEKAAYDMTCFLDDFMWFNNETKTILIISASEGYEDEVSKIEEFANSMLKNPTIAYGTPTLPGIEVMSIFITE